MNEAFWKMLDEMIAQHEIAIDRPKGSCHPRYEHIVYQVDYGYLRGTKAMDGSGIDVWLGSLSERRVGAVICTVDRLKSDAEIKLLIGCTQQEMKYIERFHNESGYMKGLLMVRGKQV